MTPASEVQIPAGDDLLNWRELLEDRLRAVKNGGPSVAGMRYEDKSVKRRSSVWTHVRAFAKADRAWHQPSSALRGDVMAARTSLRVCGVGFQEQSGVVRERTLVAG